MADMLVKLYALPPVAVTPGGARFDVRKPIGPEHSVIVDWVGQRFGTVWAGEAQVALGNRPVSLRVAVHQSSLLGFACYDATALGYLGPIGVSVEARQQGVGARLLRSCLEDMRAAGYGYAIIGAVGPTAFFERVAHAVEIADSSPGLYRDRIRGSP